MHGVPWFPMAAGPWLPMPPDYLLDQLLFGARSSKRHSEALAHLWCPMVSYGFQWQPSDYQTGPWLPMPPDHLLDQLLFGARSSKRHSEAPALRLQTTGDPHRLSPKRSVHHTIPSACHASRPLTLFGVYAGIIFIILGIDFKNDVVPTWL